MRNIVWTLAVLSVAPMLIPSTSPANAAVERRSSMGTATRTPQRCRPGPECHRYELDGIDGVFEGRGHHVRHRCWPVGTFNGEAGVAWGRDVAQWVTITGGTGTSAGAADTGPSPP